MELSRSTYYYREQRSKAKQTEELAMVKQLERLAKTHTQYGVRRYDGEETMNDESQTRIHRRGGEEIDMA